MSDELGNGEWEIKTVIIPIMLVATTLSLAQTMHLQRGTGTGGYSDGSSLIPQVPKEIIVDHNLKMNELVSSLYTNSTKHKSSIRITVTHKDKIAQRPDICVAAVTPDLIQELYKLRNAYIGLINRVAYENADMQMEGVPNVTTGYGHRRSNVIKRSERDKESNRRRAEQSAILQLKRLIKSQFKVQIFGVTNYDTYHYKIPDGEYLLCVIQRVKDTTSTSALGSKTALWWTRFAIENEVPRALYLDETNAISWDEIFVTE